MSGLSKKQRELVREIEQITKHLGFDPNDPAHGRGKDLTINLRLSKDQMIRSQVVMVYTFIDELLNRAICRKMFGWAKSEFEFNRTKKYRAFHNSILEKLPLVQKIDFVKATYHLPVATTKNIYALNDLRNAVAHSFFPNRRRIEPLWKGQNIFSIEGFSAFRNDMALTCRLLSKRYW